MKQIRSLSEFSGMSEYARLYPKRLMNKRDRLNMTGQILISSQNSLLWSTPLKKKLWEILL